VCLWKFFEISSRTLSSLLSCLLFILTSLEGYSQFGHLFLKIGVRRSR
jgi:hypothetical protein